MSDQNTRSGSGYNSEQVKIDYVQVAESTAELNRMAEAEIERIRNEYSFVFRKLSDRDGSTNATLINVARENEEKACEIARTLQQVIDAVASASKHAESTEKVIASYFNKERIGGA